MVRETAAHPLRNDMKRRSIGIYILALFFFGMLSAAAIAVFRVNLRSGDERAVAVMSRRDSRSQAARWIFHQTPFCYRFKEKVAYLPNLYPFTQDLGRIERQNSHGFRTAEYTIAHPPNTFRILILGNGLVWSAAVPVEQTFSYVTATMMNRTCTNFHTEVIADAISGSRLADNLIRLLAHGQYLKPDLVIFQMSPGDLNLYNYGTIFFLHGIEKLFAAYSAKEAEVLSENSADWMVFDETLTKIKEWSDEKKTPVAFLVFPEIDVQRSGNNFSQYDAQRVAGMPQISQFHKVVDQIQNKGFPTLYLQETIKKSNQYLTISEQIPDLNPSAQRLVAETLVSFLFDQRLVGCLQTNMHKQDIHWKEERALREKAAAEWENYNASFTTQLSFFQALADLYPRDPWVTTELADTYFNLKQYRQSYKMYASLLDIAPDISAPWYHMAISGGRPETRTGLLEQMLKAVPDHTLTMQALVPLYLQTKRKADACRLLTRILEIPTYAEEYNSAKKAFDENRCASTATATTGK